MGPAYLRWTVSITLGLALLVGLLAHSLVLAGVCVGLGAATIGWAYLVEWGHR